MSKPQFMPYICKPTVGMFVKSPFYDRKTTQRRTCSAHCRCRRGRVPGERIRRRFHGGHRQTGRHQQRRAVPPFPQQGRGAGVCQPGVYGAGGGTYAAAHRQPHRGRRAATLHTALYQPLGHPPQRAGVLLPGDGQGLPRSRPAGRVRRLCLGNAGFHTIGIPGRD